jgi:hypothetical protein
MKKLLALIVLVFTLTLNAQSNLTLVISDNVQSGYFKQEKFNWVLQGFKTSTEANDFLTKLKRDTNIKSASLTPAKANGNYDFSLSVNKISGRKYFERVLYSLGVRYAMVNGKKEDLNPAVSKASEN